MLNAHQHGHEVDVHLKSLRNEMEWDASISFKGNKESGWWFQPTPLNNDGVRKCWDDDIPFPMET
jgi:hypothetical protein